jgi:S-adenosylmethionine hydrolase
MKGVIATRAPGHLVVDVTHGVPAQDVRAGALVLAHAVPYFSRGTIHVAVVDPGVGSDRAALCIETRTALFVGPDNGVLTLAAPRDARLRAFALTNERFHLVPRSATFHGRDVFAPVAAALAAGADPAELGPAVDVAVELELPPPELTDGTLVGRVVYVDGFGNLVTNVPADALPAGEVVIEVGGHAIGSLGRTYADGAPGGAVAVIGSWGLLEVAVRNGSAATTLGAGVDTPVRIARS